MTDSSRDSLSQESNRNDLEPKGEGASPFKSEIIEVLVGPNQERFNVHKDAICDDSPFFKLCLTVNMTETKTQTVKLPEDDPKTFEHILRWVYRKDIQVPAELTLSAMKNLVGAYFLADRLCMEALCNSLMSTIMSGHQGVTTSYPSLILNMTASPLKEYLVKQLAWDLHHITNMWNQPLTSAELEGFFRSGAPEVVEVMKAQGEVAMETNRLPPCQGLMCKYHKHVDTEECEV